MNPVAIPIRHNGATVFALVDAADALLARVILDAKRGDKVLNLDGDGLNCTRANLRLKTKASA